MTLKNWKPKCSTKYPRAYGHKIWITLRTLSIPILLTLDLIIPATFYQITNKGKKYVPPLKLFGITTHNKEL